MNPSILQPSESGVAESQTIRLARRLGRFAPYPLADAIYTPSEKEAAVAAQRWGRGSQGDMLAAQKNQSYIPFIARLETFIMFTYPDTPAALRLHLVRMLGSDSNKDLDVLYREFVELYGHQWEELA